MEDYYEYLDSNGVTTLYKLIKDDTVALIDSYSVTINGITTNLDNHVNNVDIHTPVADIEGMIDTAIGSLNFTTPDYVDTKVAELVNSAPETLNTLKELSDALGNDTNFATTVANQIGSKADKDSVYTKLETDTLLEGKANSVHSHVVSDITDFPTIPTKTSQLINDSGFLTGSNGLITSVSWNDITNKPNFSTVATSGSYTDLDNTPTIPTKVSQLENDMGFGTGGDTSDCVHKTGNETIDGAKTFTQGITIKKSDIDLTTTPTSNKYSQFPFTDKNNKLLCIVQYAQRSTDVNDLDLYVYDKNSSAHGIQITTNNEVLPIGNNYSLGSSSGNKWTNVYATTFNGNLKGNADSSTKASYLDSYSLPGGNKIYLDWDVQKESYVGLKVDNTVMGGLITTNNIGSQRAGNGIDSSGGNYVKFKDGTQICWGSGKNGVKVTFANAFKSTPYIFFGYNIGANNDQVVHGQAKYSSSTSFTMQVWNFNKNDWEDGRSLEWIAIGRWK